MEQAMAYDCQQTVPPSPAAPERPDPPVKSAPPVRRSRRRRLGGAAAYYALAGLASVAVLPATSITAAVFLVTGAVVPALGLLAALASLVGAQVPWVSVQMGGYTAPPLLAYPVTVAAGLLLLLAGRGLWRFTVGFVRLLFAKKKKLRK